MATVERRGIRTRRLAALALALVLLPAAPVLAAAEPPVPAPAPAPVPVPVPRPDPKPGPPPWIDRLAVVPDRPAVAPGELRIVTVLGHGGQHDPVDVTKWTSFSAKDVTCTSAGCISDVLGEHRVGMSLRLTVDGKTRVVDGAFSIRVLLPRSAEIVPRLAKVAAGEQSEPFSVVAHGIDPKTGEQVDLGDLTGRATITARPPATCTQDHTCTAEKSGSYDVVATVPGVDTPPPATLEVTPADAATLELTPRESTIPVGGSQPYTVLGRDRFGNETELRDEVDLTVPKPAWCDGLSCGANEPGTYEVTARLRQGKAQGTATLHVGDPVARLEIRSDGAQIVAGAQRKFTAFAYDHRDRPLGDVTDRTTFTMHPDPEDPRLPDGDCQGRSCGAEKAGIYRVVGRLAGTKVSGKTTVTVIAGDPVELSLEPADETIVAGAEALYEVRGRDRHGNDVGDLTAAAEFSISPAGSCPDSGPRCTADRPDDYTVTATVPRYGLSRSVTLHVTVGEVRELELRPSDAVIVAGARQQYEVRGRDDRHNDVGDVTTSAEVRIGGVICPEARCRSTVPGRHVVTADRPGATTARAVLTVLAGPPAVLRLEPASASIAPGEIVTYRVFGEDGFGNPVGDVTTGTKVTVAGGSCTRERCTAHSGGRHTVTAQREGARPGTATLTVDGRESARILLSPSVATATVGATRVFRAEGFAADGRSIGDVTPEVEFTLGSAGFCRRAACTARIPGEHEVTGRLIGKDVVDTAILRVNGPPPPPPPPPGGTGPIGPRTGSEIARLALEPRIATISLGATQAYRVRAFGPGGTDLGDVTAQAKVWIEGRTCDAGRCTPAAPGTHRVLAQLGGVRAEATLEVKDGLVVALSLDPADASVTVGAEQAYTVRGLDATGEDVGDLTHRVGLDIRLAIEQPGSCLAARCRSSYAGDLTVTATGGRGVAAATAMLRVLTEEPARLVIDRPSDTVTPGTRQSYRVRGLDARRNDLGDLTARATFQIAPSGQCERDQCFATEPGEHTVTAIVARPRGPALTASVTLHVVQTESLAVPLVLLVIGAFLVVSGGSVLARAPAGPDESRPGRPRRGLPVRATPRPAAARLQLGDSTDGDVDWAVRIAPRPGPPTTPTLEEGRSDDRSGG